MARGEQKEDECEGHQCDEPFLPHCGLHLRLLDCQWNICRSDGKIANVENWQNKSSNISQTTTTTTTTSMPGSYIVLLDSASNKNRKAIERPVPNTAKRQKRERESFHEKEEEEEERKKETQETLIESLVFVSHDKCYPLALK